MSHEGVPPAIFNEDGSLNVGILGEQFGLGAEEAMQEVTWGSYSGTVAEMLGDARCPVGGMVRNAYEKNGIDGVATQFGLLSQMDENFSVEITEATLEREYVKKNQIFPNQQTT